MQNHISTCIWCDNNGQEVASFYCSIFPNSHIDTQNEVVTSFHIDGTSLTTLNGGNQFRSNPSASFYTTVENEDELHTIWDKLIDGGKVLMPLDKYEWSPLYGWLEDKYGVSWQLTFGEIDAVGKRVIPFLMFCGANQGKAEDAMNFYQKMMPPAKEAVIIHYQEGQVSVDAKVVHAKFYIGENVFMAIDSGISQPFTFNEGVSFIIHCNNQEEIDYYWNTITENGKESMCGWCTDQFGVSWQIAPVQIAALLSQLEKRERVFKVLMQMKKIDLVYYSLS